jgi:hypothetical protein
MSSNGSGRKRGQQSRYLNGGISALLRGRAQPGDELEGTWTREELQRMHDRFVAAVEAAMRLGLENRASASACKRPGAGDRDRLSLAS